MSTASLEARIAALEREVRHLKDLVDKGQRKRGWRIIIGAFANDPLYEEAMRLGREYRESQRPRKRKKSQKAKGKHDRT
jgi:hypothetical protein